MIKKQLVKCIPLVLVFASTVATADLQKGIDAANVGDFETALFEFNYLVKNNYPPAMYQLGQLYENGTGVARDYKKAAELYTKAADMDEVDAMFSLGVLYHHGDGVTKNLSKALELYTQAASKGLAAAQFNLGTMYSNGVGVTQDYINAKQWYMKAAAQNYASAQFNLALMYAEGQGVEKSDEMSFIWNSIAEFNGYKDATHSRRLDERKMSPSQVESATEKANEMYQKILDGKFYSDDRRI